MIRNIRYLPIEIQLEIVLSIDDLDTVIELATHTPAINNYLKTPESIEVVRRNINVQKPIISRVICSDDGQCTTPWDELSNVYIAEPQRVCHKNKLSALSERIVRLILLFMPILQSVNRLITLC